MKGLISAVLLIFISCAIGQKCPAPGDIFPCYCFELNANESQIECTGKDLTEIDLYRIAQKVISPTGKYAELYIHDSKVGIIPANTFRDTQFERVIIEYNEDLKLIDPHAFKTGVTDRLVIRRNKSLKDTNIYTLTQVLNPTEARFDGNSLEMIPENAFRPIIANSSRLQKVFLNNNKIKVVHPNAFNGLHLLTTVSLDFNEIEAINTNGLAFESSEVEREISFRLGFNKISESSFHRGAIVVPENVTLSLHLEANNLRYVPEYEFGYLSSPGNAIYLSGNSVTCDCNAAWLFKSIDVSTVSGIKCTVLGQTTRDINDLQVTDVCPSAVLPIV